MMCLSEIEFITFIFQRLVCKANASIEKGASSPRHSVGGVGVFVGLGLLFGLYRMQYPWITLET